MLGVIEQSLIDARPAYKKVAPGPAAILGGTHGKVLRYARLGWSVRKQLRAGKSKTDIIGEYLANNITGKVMTKPRKTITDMHINAARINHDWKRKNGIGSRSWIWEPGRYEMVMIFHDANRAGGHIDIHIGRVSLIYRVKPDDYAKLKFNREGYLTEDSRKLLIEHVRKEVANGSRVPQNLDHSKTNAKASWVGGDPNGTSYGAGRSRQIIAISDIDIYKAYYNGPIEMYSPLINPDASLYLYKLYSGQGKTAPILVWGEKNKQPPVLEDRLHLKMVLPEDLDKAQSKLDMRTSTVKYDGSSTYFVITPKGTTLYSPRQSVISGAQINYSNKLNGVIMTTNHETIVGMGEVLFVKTDRWGNKHYLSCAEGSGILNSHDLLPKDIKPEIRIYRIDRVGRTSTIDLPFEENRKLQFKTARLGEHFKVVERASPQKALREGYEGVVIAKPGRPITEGIKVKWWADLEDWRIDQVAFLPGERGGIAGVIYCTKLDNNQQYKLGPGSTGNRELVLDMMNNPKLYEGTVVKVQGRTGHSGRAAKIVATHDDKGYAPV